MEEKVPFKMRPEGVRDVKKEQTDLVREKTSYVKASGNNERCLDDLVCLRESGKS